MIKTGKRQPAKSKKSSRKGASTSSPETPVKHNAAPLIENADGAEAACRDGGILDELLAGEIDENSRDTLCLSESPDKTLQRECMIALREPGLKPHERLKIIQTLDKVNERIARSGPKEDVAESLHAWIAEVMDGGPGPMSEATP